MVTLLPSWVVLLTAITYLQPGNAFPNFGDATVAYLTNCQTSDTGVGYSEVSIYSDVTKSFNGEGPDAYSDTFLGQVLTWEGGRVGWPFSGQDPTQADDFTEFINSNAQDPAVPTFGQVGCGAYTEGFTGGAILRNFNCFKDKPRLLYSTSDHSCTTIYYCSLVETQCTLSPPGKFLLLPGHQVAYHS
jgi:hypothetical protein